MVLSTADPFEKRFRNWYTEYSTKAGISPDPDDPRHFYDYRAYFKSFLRDPQKYAPVIDPIDLNWHLPDEFKLKGHPTYPGKGP